MKDRMIVVQVISDTFGDCWGLVRTLDAARMRVEMCYAPPIGTWIEVRFMSARGGDEDDLSMYCQVEGHDAIAGTGKPPSSRAITMSVMAFAKLDVCDSSRMH